jgi:peptidoglycan hydrolase-like protein with peptidoglycan-binding domain
LQSFLNQNKFTVSETGGGSAGQETTYFGPKTKAALIKFQEYYHADILDPLGLPKGTGYLGEKTRSYLNSIAK